MSRSGHRVELTRREFLGGATALGLPTVLESSIAWAQKPAIRLAFIGPLTGGTASNGLGGRNSFLLAVQERNADPRTKYTYETEVLDDECKPTVAVQAALKASSDPAIVAGVTHYCSVTAIATVDTYHKAGMPAMVWGAVLPEITYSHTYVEITRVNGTMINQNNVAADFAVRTLGFKTFALIHDTTDYGRAHAKWFGEFLDKAGGKVLSTQGTAKDQKDYTAELTRAKADRPEVVWYGGLTPDGVRRGHARVRRRRADGEAAGRQAVPRGVREGGVQGAVGGVRAVRLRRREPRHRRDRGGRPRPREGGRAAQAHEEPDHDHRPRRVRRVRAEHRLAHLQVREPGRQVGALGGLGVRLR